VADRSEDSNPAHSRDLAGTGTGSSCVPGAVIGCGSIVVVVVASLTTRV